MYIEKSFYAYFSVAFQRSYFDHWNQGLFCCSIKRNRLVLLSCFLFTFLFIWCSCCLFLYLPFSCNLEFFDTDKSCFSSLQRFAFCIKKGSFLCMLFSSPSPCSSSYSLLLHPLLLFPFEISFPRYVCALECVYVLSWCYAKNVEFSSSEVNRMIICSA